MDYDSSVEEVFTSLAKHLLTVQPGLRVLSSVVLQHRRHSTLHLPTWVPDWSQRQWGGGILQKYYRFSQSKLFKAGGIGPCRRVEEAEGMNTICLEGIRVGSIETIVDVKSILGADDAFVVTEDKIRMITRQAGLEGHYPFTGEPFWKVIFHVLTADRSAISSRVSEDYRQRYFAEFSQCNSDLLPNERLEDLPAAACAEISKTLDAIIEDKVLFIMKEGYVGLGQEGFEVTDVVGILVGGETPFAFRASSVAGCGRFRFLSECYVHGVMDGELAGSFSKGYSRFSIE